MPRPLEALSAIFLLAMFETRRLGGAVFALTRCSALFVLDVVGAGEFYGTGARAACENEESRCNYEKRDLQTVHNVILLVSDRSTIPPQQGCFAIHAERS